MIKSINCMEIDVSESDDESEEEEEQ